MSVFTIQQYYKEIEDNIHYGGTSKETAIRSAFFNLLNKYAKQKGHILVAEVSLKVGKKTITPDGTVRDSLQLDWGYWEAKDEADDIDEEIAKKFAKNYPKDNILFEDSRTAVLYQEGHEVMRINMKDAEKLDRLLLAFVNFVRQEIKDFYVAIERFKEDVPKVTSALRENIMAQEKGNPKYISARNAFWELCKQSINPEVTLDDVREMMIQHILTADIFNTVFDESHFHRENNIARELEKVLDTFFTGTTRRTVLAAIQHYYQVINARAAAIADHHEKQFFLKVVYETFYKSYNPKAADRLGVVYTPNQIVRFMIESTDYLLHKHFGKMLGDKGVEIMDPATGTGTFICDIIDYLPKDKLEYKYTNELHANEIAILPYYIANLNIEFTYKQRMKEYREYKRLCFVDTLDNMGFGYKGKQTDMFAVTAENAERIKDQNARKISVIIGNPPYNAKQENYNFQNANRAYKIIDQRIKDSYIKDGTAQNQIVVYDMYTRFYRWAMDRLDNNGIIAFITNRSFIDSRAFDGFRKCIQDEFDFAYILDTKSDVRANPKIAGTSHNVFGIQTGVAIMLLVRKDENRTGRCRISYHALDDYMLKEDKLTWIFEHKLQDIPFDNIIPDKKNNWINQSDNDFETLLPLMDKDVKAGKAGKAIFENFSRGVATQKDEWVYDLKKNGLEKKIKFFVEKYQQTLKNADYKEKQLIKWDEDLETYLKRGIKKEFDNKQMIKAAYRPYFNQILYLDRHFNGRTYQWFDIHSFQNRNKYIAINSPGNLKGFHCLGSDGIIDLHFTGDSQCLPLHRFDAKGNRIENITDWGLQQFCKYYKAQPAVKETEIAAVASTGFLPDEGFEQPHLTSNEAQQFHEPAATYGLVISKEDIFHYVYAVLHNPAYRTKYEQNLKREFPRIPFYDDFAKWRDWGKTLMDLHINYETVEPFALKEATDKDIKKPKAKLKADKDSGIIILDEATSLLGIPATAWQYKLGNRSALEWILDQYKEKTPKDPTIAEKFNTYRFADYKAQVIDLLKRVTTVSVKTQEIVGEMEKIK